MSTLKVSIEEVLEVNPHENADRLDLISILGWNVISQKGIWNKGDLALYIPIDSILPKEIEDKIFGPDSKIKLNGSRVRTIKLRGCISQGMIVKPEILGINKYKLGDDFTDFLGIKKFEPPVELPRGIGICNQVKKKDKNHNFKEYTDIENIKNYHKVFEEGEFVYVSEKLHGTSFRCGYVETEANTLWKKILKIFNILPKYEFVYGSRRVQLQNKKFNGFYEENVYAKAVDKYNLKEKLKPGEVIYGEIIGPGIQKGYTYGVKEGDIEFYAYDLKKDDMFIDFCFLRSICDARRIPVVPQIYVGQYHVDKIKELTKGNSVLCPEQKIREGCVVKPVKERMNKYTGRTVLKSINDDYLLDKGNTDFH